MGRSRSVGFSSILSPYWRFSGLFFGSNKPDKSEGFGHGTRKPVERLGAPRRSVSPNPSVSQPGVFNEVRLGYELRRQKEAIFKDMDLNPARAMLPMHKKHMSEYPGNT
jgi:hypothetical protein